MGKVTSLDVLKPGLALGRYECLVPIARGGMAAVWAGRLCGVGGFERLVAIKTILPMLSDDPSFVQMFLDEARIASRIRHPNVAQVIDLGEQGEMLFLVMEWVEGEPLSVLLREGLSRGFPLPLPVVGRVLVDMCAGLHAAHELVGRDGALLGLVHRDISPQNVLVSTEGHIKLVDFGVAKATLRAGSETAPGVLKGKAGYIAPEQALSMPVDRRADLFAAGVLLFQMIAGRHPFRGDNDVATITNLLSRSVPPPSSVSIRPLPAALDAVALRALARRPDERYATALELAAAIEAALGEPLASSVEVAAFSALVAGERAAERRQMLRDAIAELDRGPPSLDSIPPPTPIVSPDVSARWSMEHSESITAHSVTAPSLQIPPSEASAPAVEPPTSPLTSSAARKRWFALAALPLLGLVLAAWPRPVAPEAPAREPPPVASIITLAPTVSALPSASAAPQPAPLASPARTKKRDPALPTPGGAGRWAQPVPTPGF